MKKLLLSVFLVGGLSLNAQTVLFEDSFETYDDFLITGFGNWETLDLDLRPTYTGGTDEDGPGPQWNNAGAAQAFQIFNPTTALTINGSGTPPAGENRNFDPKTGSKYAASWAAVPNATQPANHDWLISPPITLGASGNELKLWVKSMSDSYGLEEYSIGVYLGSGSPVDSSEFSILLGVLEAPFPDWEELTIGLDAYSGQTVRIGVRNEGDDHYMFMVDDVSVTTTTMGVNDTVSNKFSVSPNPASSVVNVTNDSNIVISDVTFTDVNGRIVKTVKANSHDVQVNVSDLTAGIYFMNIDSAEGKAVKKFIKS